MLAFLPEKISRREIRARLGRAFEDRLQRIFTSHADPGYYTIRDVVAYGIGECERSRIAADRLEQEDLKGFGELMLLSHDGDRVNGQPAIQPATAEGHAECLHRLIGAYACSTPNIDKMIDIVRVIPGVYGAQLAGAGLGGCVMILARQSAVPRIKTALAREYYRALGLPPTVWRVRPVTGGGIVRP